jgi:hypothetical protein
MHTYHPLRVPNEIYWYSKNVNKPWMIGETSLPADNDSISYSDQTQFLKEAYLRTKNCGGSGFGWWAFQDVTSWGTFEHKNNPGRCDAIGCYDSFGARRHAVMPNDRQANTQYGPCNKTLELKRMMQTAGLADVWQNYCLKSTQVSFTNAAGKPTVLTNSVTERLSVNGELIGSCISCHAYAAFGANGAPTSAALTMLAYNPVGKPIPSAFEGAMPNDFMWGIINFLNGN